MSPGTGKPPCKREVQHRCASLAKGTTLTTGDKNTCHDGIDAQIEQSMCGDIEMLRKGCKEMKTPKTPKPSVELAVAGEEQACIFDSTPAMTSPESASKEPSDDAVRKP